MVGPVAAASPLLAIAATADQRLGASRQLPRCLDAPPVALPEGAAAVPLLQALPSCCTVRIALASRRGQVWTAICVLAALHWPWPAWLAAIRGARRPFAAALQLCSLASLQNITEALRANMAAALSTAGCRPFCAARQAPSSQQQRRLGASATVSRGSRRLAVVAAAADTSEVSGRKGCTICCCRAALAACLRSCLIAPCVFHQAM